MAVADVNRDDIMDPSEYVRFVSRLGMTTFAGEEFTELHPTLQENYSFLAMEDGIDITGSKPGQEVDDDSHLRRICATTLTAVENAPGGSPTDEDEVDLSMCFLSLVVSDRNRDSELDQTEYVFFIVRFSQGSIEAEEFAELDALFQENFDAIAPSGTFDISGSMPGQTPTDELVAACELTHDIVVALSAP